MELLSELRGDTLIVRVDAERIDAAIALQFKESMRKATQDGPDRVILEMTQVAFVDSSGLGAIVGSMKQLPAGKAMELSNLSQTVAKVFQLTRMDTIFLIHETLDQALEEQPV